MTFEIQFEHKDTTYTAVVTPNGRDFLANLVRPVQYEVTPTIVFTVHEDQSMNYDNTLFDDEEFLPKMESAIKQFIREKNLAIDAG